MQYTYKVYAQLDAQGRITAVNSSAFLPAPIPEGWVQIDEGEGDKYHHAQGNYFTAPLHDERGVCRYAHVPDAADGAQKWRERAQAEMDADYTPPVPAPTLGERVAAVEAGQATQDTAIDELVQVMADMIGGAV